MFRSRTYLDYAGAMPPVYSAVKEFERAQKIYGNPSALHTEGETAKAALSDARQEVASLLGCKARDLIFISGGTEGNNLAILGLYEGLKNKGIDIKDTHWIVSSIEHSSVLECFNYLQRQGAQVTRVAPDYKGQIRADDIEKELTPSTVCVSIGWVNGEVGTGQPLSKISQKIRAYEKEKSTKIVFHSDAGQAPLHSSAQVHSLGVDLLVLDGGKLGSVRGVGVVFCAYGTELSPIIRGGGQERGLRAGTENVALAISFAAAYRHLCNVRDSETKRLEKVRDELHIRVGKSVELSSAVVNGEGVYQSPHIYNFSIPNINNEYIALALDSRGLAVATKSACEEGQSASHVVLAMHPKAEWRAENALRVSFGPQTSIRDISNFVKTLEDVLKEYRVHSS